MKLTHLLTATAAAALLGGAAYAQSTDSTSMPQAPTTGSVAADQPAQDTTAPTGTMSSAPAASSDTAAVNPPAPATTDTTVAADASTTTTSAGTFTNMTVTNGPVPDTAENRQKYGSPMSRAGKRTAARGN